MTGARFAALRSRLFPITLQVPASMTSPGVHPTSLSLKHCSSDGNRDSQEYFRVYFETYRGETPMKIFMSPAEESDHYCSLRSVSCAVVTHCQLSCILWNAIEEMRAPRA
ncbi:uncharacterized protein EDB91DRAFT_1167643 [Suillus paluster]|uniref:uncharacterized protein n=1 Tax=Suillus paluster TaxID=48578 RepID=UPI001B863BF6|nr:uncharacterized protein EDB91DRAFT_1167643 [Suillus paluster]KAG1725712.1 hypothetical protein EDB91DRAFT_1167643 [Suillus paluster]